MYLIYEFKLVILIVNSNFVREPIDINFFYSNFCERVELELWVQVSEPNGVLLVGYFSVPYCKFLKFIIPRIGKDCKDFVSHFLVEIYTFIIPRIGNSLCLIFWLRLKLALGFNVCRTFTLKNTNI